MRKHLLDSNELGKKFVVCDVKWFEDGEITCDAIIALDSMENLGIEEDSEEDDRILFYCSDGMQGLHRLMSDGQENGEDFMVIENIDGSQFFGTLEEAIDRQYPCDGKKHGKTDWGEVRNEIMSNK